MDLSHILLKPYPQQFRPKKKYTPKVIGVNRINTHGFTGIDMLPRRSKDLPSHLQGKDAKEDCEYCDYKFSHTYALMRHQAFIHNRRNIFKYTYVNENGATVTEWKRSKPKRKPRLPRIYACKFRDCNSKFAHQRNRQQHEVKMHGIYYEQEYPEEV